MTQALTIRNGREDAPADALEIRSLDDVMRYAEIFCKSGYFSDAQQANQAAVKILAGQELGIKPFQAMRGIYIIKGNACLSAGLMASIIKASGKYDYRVLEQSATICRIVFLVRNLAGQFDELGESAFSIEDAQRQGTQNIDKFAINMLFNRAMSNGVKWYCPDIFSGPVYAPEDMGATVNGATGEIITLPDAPAASTTTAASTTDTKGAKSPATPTISSRLRSAVRKVWEKTQRDLKTGPISQALNVACEDDGQTPVDLETFNDAGLVLLLRYAMRGEVLLPSDEPPTASDILASAKAFLA